MAIGLFDTTDGELRLRRSLEVDVIGTQTEVKELAGETVPDLILPNHMDLAYAKIRFDERSLATLTERLRNLSDPLARALSWNAVWDMVRDAELAARRFLDLALNNLPYESDIGVIKDFLGRAFSAIGIYGDPANRPSARAKLAAKAREQLLAAEAGSDFQLAWARAFIAAARDKEDLSFMRGLLEGEENVPGLEIDTDLRWHIAMSLAVAGAADDALISAELERDPTDQGERYAAAARAARPLAEAKAEAWETIIGDSAISLAMLRAIMGGFQPSDQEKLVEPFAPRYFDELLPFWQRRDSELGRAFAGGMYRELYTEEIVRRTDELLAAELPPMIRRILVEQRDDTLRVMRGRECDSLEN
jgi:aminopeptidase N